MQEATGCWDLDYFLQHFLKQLLVSPAPEPQEQFFDWSTIA